MKKSKSKNSPYDGTKFEALNEFALEQLENTGGTSSVLKGSKS